jgi:hypothetical protein
MVRSANVGVQMMAWENLGARIGTRYSPNGAGDVFFTTDDNVRMTIKENGNVGIGTADPVAKLDVAGDTRIRGGATVTGAAEIQRHFVVGARGLLTDDVAMRIWVPNDDGSDFYPLIVNAGPDTVFRLKRGPPNANVLHMFGSAAKTSGGTSWQIISDHRVKQQVRPYEHGLNEISRLRPVRFRYRDDPKHGLTSAKEEVGFIAQEVREVIPDAVTEGKDGYLTLNADPIHWATINAIRELNTKLERKDARIAALEQRLEALEQLISRQHGVAK